MNSKKLLSLWGLKWNPFSPELPSDGLLVTPKIDQFAWRVEQLVQEGGFALITGESGTGKSVALRIVAARLAMLRDVTVGVIERPQSKSADFYRELGDIFAVNYAAFGLVMVLFLVLEPLGLVGIWRRLQNYFLLWPFKYRPLAGARK